MEVDGEISSVLAGTMFRVKLESGHEVLAHISGKMRKRFIRLVVGDKVKMEMSPYDMEKARIGHHIQCIQNTPDVYVTINRVACIEIGCRRAVNDQIDVRSQHAERLAHQAKTTQSDIASQFGKAARFGHRIIQIKIASDKNATVIGIHITVFADKRDNGMASSGQLVSKLPANSPRGACQQNIHGVSSKLPVRVPRH